MGYANLMGEHEVKIVEVWTKVKAVEFGFIGSAVVVSFRTEPCAQHCLSWLKANPAFVITKHGAGWC